jgi:uncharacterized membrane protein YdbT with pleckstrin-like domain|tara:strand:- start:25338 stop:25820 length:483 start_codon:yes stop_codon:yes gene_type:complete
MATNNAVEYGNMAYEKLSLNEDEAITLELRKHPVALAKSVIGIIAVSVVLILLYALTNMWWFLLTWTWFGLLLFARYLNYRQERLFVTNQRVVFKHGIFHTRTYDIPLSRISAVSSYQSIIGRIIGYGSINIEHSEVKRTTYQLVPKPELIKRVIAQLTQ